MKWLKSVGGVALGVAAGLILLVVVLPDFVANVLGLGDETEGDGK